MPDDDEIYRLYAVKPYSAANPQGYILKNNRQIKLIAASVAVAASFQAHAGLGGLNIQSNLDEPFSGSITVTGEEAKALLGGGSVTVSEKA